MSAAMLVDSHCHLDYPEMDDARGALLERAREAGVGCMVSIGVRISQFERIYALTQRHAEIYAAVGVHPHEAGREGLSDPAPLLDYARRDKVVAIGESGLDYFYQHAPKEDQQRSFRTHIVAARQTQLPLVVHTRDADDDTLAILREGHQDGAFPCVIHCFTGGLELMRGCVDMGHYISISGVATFKKSEELRQIFAQVPPERLLVETDSPYLAPAPHRGKPNEPAYVAHTARFMADYLGHSFEDFATQTSDNFFRLFSKVPRDLVEASFRQAA